ncbi:MAG: DUF455 family protein [Chlamydiales bacterium]|nr:DUF455 family protein [Chlamydiales bacterium]
MIESRFTPALSVDMEIQEWALRILSADTLEEKLLDPGLLTDFEPGPAQIWNEPARPPGMGFRRHSKKEKLPSFHEHHTSDNRAICLHRFAGHELLAVEIMAYALLAFPEMPFHFRKGVANTLKEEQEHVRLYIQRMEALHLRFGDLPLYRHFWSYIPHLTSPIAYISVMSLTFEMANLDFAPLYGKSFQRAGDFESAALMERILQDEISHVAFGWNWLKKLKSPDHSEWESWESNLPPLMTPKRARGFTLFEENRRKAGIPQEWIDRFK